MTGTTEMTFDEGCMWVAAAIILVLVGMALAELATQFLSRFWKLK